MRSLYLARSLAVGWRHRRVFLSSAISDSVQPTPSVTTPHRPVKALFIDATGTLLYPAQPVSKIYQRFSLRHGIRVSESQILTGFRDAFENPPRPNLWSSTGLRYVGDAKDFWRHVVFKATGSDSESLFNDLYRYYEQRVAWDVPPDAKPALLRLKRQGIKTVVVSNFDTRLRPLLETMGFGEVFDVVIVSAEVGMEKPNPCIFERALTAAQCDPREVIHVGDDRRNDIWGAREAGIDAWLWGVDVTSFHDIAERILILEGDCHQV